MSVTVPRLMLMALLLSPSLSWALGLGEIHLNSSLNEPMNAEIDLIAAAPEELTALRASLASRDAFTRYGIDRPPFLSTLAFKVGKNKSGRDVLFVSSTDAIPEPFVTFLVEVNWARGRLMREYTVLLDPPVYTPGERASSAAPVSAPTSSPAGSPSVPAPAPRAARAAPSISAGAGPGAGADAAAPPRTHTRAAASAPSSDALAAANGYHVAPGDTLSKIVRGLRDGPTSGVDQTMIAVYRANPDAFGGNINILKQGAVLRMPGADEIAALNQTEAVSEVHRQMDAWRGNGGESSGHLRLVTPGSGTGTAGSGGGAAGGGNSAGADGGADATALRGRVKDLESQLADSKRLLDIRNNELAELQRKLGAAASAPNAPVSSTPVPGAGVPTPAPLTKTPVPPVATAPLPMPPVPAETTGAPSAVTSTQLPPEETTKPVPVNAPPVAKKPAAAPAPESGSWIDWAQNNWWWPAGIIILLLLGLAFAAWRKRQGGTDFPGLDPSGGDDYRDSGRGRGTDDSFVVEESGEHPMPDFAPAAEHFGETTSNLKASDDTMSSESAVNLDQGDPLAEADFHMAYGLYDQAADLVRIALEREPDRRDLRMKLLEIYFVWGNKEQFLQTAKTLEATRERAPAGEWDKIVIMGKQICPDEPIFQTAAGSGRGAGALVDLNLEGGENRVDIDLFGDPEGEHGNDPLAKTGEDIATSAAPARMHADDHLDFTLDTPERGADNSPTREMPPRDEPTVESELMSFNDAPTAESPALRAGDRTSTARIPVSKNDQTAEVPIDDLGLDLDHLEDSAPHSISNSHLAETDHPSDAPTMVAGLDERSRRMMADAESRSRDKDLTELERELEASFVADLGNDQEDIKTAVLGPESAPTVQMPRKIEMDTASTSRFRSPEFSDVQDADRLDIDSTSKLRGLSADSIDLDLDRLASALGSNDTVEQPRADDEVFSNEVFEASQRSRGVDLDVGEALNGSGELPTNKLKAVSTSTTRLSAADLALPELEPVTMSEVGTKLDLARAYMDMGDPEGARSILEEVVHEGSASQKQEAQRLIEALPG